MWLCVWLLCTTWVRHDSCVTFGKENLKRNDATIPRLNFSPSSPEAHCLLPVGEAGKPVQMSCQWYWDAIKSAGRPCNQLGYVGTIWDVCAGSMVAKRAWEILGLSFLLMQSCRGLLHWAGQSCLACAFSSVSRHLLDLLKIPSWIVMMESGQQRDIRGVGFGATKESSQSSWNIICLRYRTSVGSFHRGYLPPRRVCGTDHAAGHEGQGCQARWGRHKKLQKVTWHVRVCQSLSESGPYQRTPLGNLHLSASLCISLHLSASLSESLCISLRWGRNREKAEEPHWARHWQVYGAKEFEHSHLANMANVETQRRHAESEKNGLPSEQILDFACTV